MKPKVFSIRYKFLGVTTLLLVFCVAMYLYMATTVIRTDKTQMVFDYNKSLVQNISSEAEAVFKSSLDKMQLVAYFVRTKDKNAQKLIQDLIHQGSDIVYVSGSDDFKGLKKHFFQNQKYFDVYGVEPEEFASTLAESIPFEKIRLQGQAIWNATQKNGAPLIGFGKSLIEENQHNQVIRHTAIVSYLKADKLLKSVQSGGSDHEIAIVNSEGEVLVHTNQKMMIASDGFARGKLQAIQKALKSPTKTSVVEMKIGGEKILGGISRSFANEIGVVSLVSEAKAFAVVDRLFIRSLMFALMVGTLAFIAAILFSSSLTQPIEVLVGGMKKVALGDLETHIHVKSRDEIRQLANSFNAMIADLKESRSQLEEINRDLEAKVQERTQQLEEQNQAVKSAQEALLRTTRLAAVGEIAGRAAHEVLNPLTSIFSRIEKVQGRLSGQRVAESEVIHEISSAWKEDFAQGGFEKLIASWKEPSSLDPEKSLWDEDLQNLESVYQELKIEYANLQKDLGFLNAESQRIQRIVQNMRGLSIVKSEKENHLVGDLVKDSVNIMADLASQKKIKIDIGEDFADEKFVDVDKDEFIQSMTNLLRNSIQAIESRSEVVDGAIRVTQAVQDNKVLIRLRDNGVGIAPENQNKIFENQFTTKSRSEGTGLGLNISRRFLRAVGGDLVLEESGVDQGCTFRIELPLSQDQQRKAA